MNRQALELLDIALVTIIIGLITSTSLANLYKDYRKVLENNYSYMDDKNTGKNKGFLINEYGTYDGTLSKLEVVLVSQIQDENMPNPRKIIINGLDVDIPFTYKEYAFECGQNVWLMVRNQPDNARYSLNYKFQTNGDGTLKDEYYTMNKID
ncbi:hypothetical protein EDD66_101353 [Mobilisporobacter senegalensis]|uniref:Uncharacterized protein n=1 Tax=Mobilisporobacter senegalensis TaxID=1329262 RepID=A0A3N1XYQ4_9FIRM|nr:hypothetical protein [Mobilisporobacter senegalensis]ROR31735.1 hypothetical protein EDD66_101353 [Mobilisporobacter senegalensis]